MSERKLSPEQIDNLFELCDYYYISYYDIQIELVDHMASTIETLWATNPELPFEEAAFMVGEQLGGKSGFISIRDNKSKELRRKYSRMQWKYIQEFFQLPKIILTLAITFIVYYFLKHSINYLKVSFIIEAIYVLSLLFFLTIFYPIKIKLNLIPGKEFLLYNHFKSFRKQAISIGLSSLNILSISFREINFKLDSAITVYFDPQLATSFLVTLYGIAIFAICVDSPQRIKEDFTREFPQFVKS
jgi:hypothetical protein